MKLKTASSVGEARDGFLKHTEANFTQNTLDNRRISIRQFFDYLDLDSSEDVTVLSDIDSRHVQDWINEMLLDDYAPRTVRNKQYCVSAFFGWLLTRSIVEENPCEAIDTSNYKGNKIDDFTDSRYIDIDEYELMLEHTHKTRNELLLRLLWNTGVRAQEAVDIVRDDIDLDDRSISVENTKIGKHQDPEIRDVYLSRYLTRMIERWYNGERNAYIGTGGEDDEGHLLVTKEAPHMAVNRVTEIVGEIAEDAGIQEVYYESQDGREQRRVTAHTFRHSYCVHRVKQGMPLVYLQSLAGHADISQTREYLHFRGDDIRDAEFSYRP